MSDENMLVDGLVNNDRSFRVRGSSVVEGIYKLKGTLIRPEQYKQVKHSIGYRYPKKNKPARQYQFNINDISKPLIGYYVMKGYNRHKINHQQTQSQHQNVQQIKSDKILKNFVKKYTQRKSKANFKNKVNLPLLEISNVQVDKLSLQKISNKLKTSPSLSLPMGLNHLHFNSTNTDLI